MSTITEELLEIEVEKLDPNPENRIFTLPQVEAMKASLANQGQMQPIKVMPKPGGRYMILGGHIRFLAAKELGWVTLKALSKPVEPGRVSVECALDNRYSEVFWLDRYQEIARVARDQPDLTQQSLADSLQESQQFVSGALFRLKILSKASREAIYRSSVKPDMPFLMPQDCMDRLCELLTGNGPADLETIEKAVNTVLEKRLTAPLTERLVNWVNGGHSVETFDPTNPVNPPHVDPKDPHANLWRLTPKYVNVKQRKGGYMVTLNLRYYQAAPAVFAALAGVNKLEKALGFESDGRFQDQLDAVMKGAMDEAKNAEDRERKMDAKRKAAKRLAEKQEAEADKGYLAILEEAFKDTLGTPVGTLLKLGLRGRR